MKINRKLSKSGHIVLNVSAVFAAALIYGNLVTSFVSADSLTKNNASVSARTTRSNNQASINASSSSSSTNTAHLQTIISKGDQEIERRLTTLNSLTAKINATTHLTASDKTTLSNEVSSSISGLTALKVQLDSATTLSSAITYAESIYTEYRVYALVAPKVELIKVADDQLTVQANLSALAVQLQTRITADQNAGKDVTTLQTELNSMNSSIASAGAISSNIEGTVINLQPSDYNSNHSILVGDASQLKTAHNDDQSAYNDGKTIVAGLKTLG